MDRGAHRPLACVRASIHRARATHCHACVWSGVLRLRQAGSALHCQRASAAGGLLLTAVAGCCWTAGCVGAAPAGAGAEHPQPDRPQRTFARLPMRRISRGEVHTRSHTKVGSAAVSSTLQGRTGSSGKLAVDLLQAGLGGSKWRRKAVKHTPGGGAQLFLRLGLAAAPYDCLERGCCGQCQGRSQPGGVDLHRGDGGACGHVRITKRRSRAPWPASTHHRCKLSWGRAAGGVVHRLRCSIKLDSCAWTG